MFDTVMLCFLEHGVLQVPLHVFHDPHKVMKAYKTFGVLSHVARSNKHEIDQRERECDRTGGKG